MDNLIEKAYRLAVGAGLVTKKKEFAELLNADPATVSRALAGDNEYATPRLVFRAEKILNEHGLSIYGNNNGIAQTGDNATATQEQQPPQQPSEIERLIDELAAQRETYAQQIKELQERLKQSQQTTDKLVNIITMSKQ